MDSDAAEAAGKAMAGLLLSHSLLTSLVLTGVISHKQASEMLATVKRAASELQPPAVATMAVAAISGLEASWTKTRN